MNINTLPEYFSFSWVIKFFLSNELAVSLIHADFLSWRARAESLGRAMQLESTGQSTREERAAEWGWGQKQTLEIYRVPQQEFSRTRISACVWRNYWGSGKTHSRGLERTVPGAHMGPVSYSAYSSVILENLVMRGAFSRVFRRVLGSCLNDRE